MAPAESQKPTHLIASTIPAIPGFCWAVCPGGWSNGSVATAGGKPITTFCCAPPDVTKICNCVNAMLPPVLVKHSLHKRMFSHVFALLCCKNRQTHAHVSVFVRLLAAFQPFAKGREVIPATLQKSFVVMHVRRDQARRTRLRPKQRRIRGRRETVRMRQHAGRWQSRIGIGITWRIPRAVVIAHRAWRRRSIFWPCCCWCCSWDARTGRAPGCRTIQRAPCKHVQSSSSPVSSSSRSTGSFSRFGT